MITLLKSLFQKPLFWILIGGMTLFIIGALFLSFRQNKTQFRLQPMSKEDLEVRMENGKQIVDAKKDGYLLELDPSYQVVTREIESGRVMIFKDECRVVVTKIDESEEMTVQEWFEKDFEMQRKDDFLDVIDYRIEKVSDAVIEAYKSFLNTKQFGIEEEILIQGKNGIFSITQSHRNKNCFSFEEILEGFRLNES